MDHGTPSGVCLRNLQERIGLWQSSWMASMSEADRVFVLDTGSEDGTPARLRELGAEVVEERIQPLAL